MKPSALFLFSYVLNRSAVEKAAVFAGFARRTYLRKALLLVFTLPLDLLAWCVLRLRPGQGREFILLGARAGALLGELHGARAAVLGTLTDLPRALRAGALWIPVGPLYITLALCRWSLQPQVPVLVALAMRGLGALIERHLHAGATLVLHSDALPLARALIVIVRARGGTVCCLQHGLLHETSEMNEIDGSLSDVNVVRSRAAAGLIARANADSRFLVEPDLFIPSLPAGERSSRAVVLVGEAWHVCDQALHDTYMRRLRTLQRELAALGVASVFRPHPLERVRSVGYGFVRLDLAPAARSLARHAAFVGYSSTLLHEAASVGRLAMQLTLSGFPLPALDASTALPVHTVSTADDLARLLRDHQRSETATAVTTQRRVQDAARRVLEGIAPPHEPTPTVSATGVRTETSR